MTVPANYGTEYSSITILTTKDHNEAEYACVVKYRNDAIRILKRTAELDVTCEYDVPALINLIFLLIMMSEEMTYHI